MAEAERSGARGAGGEWAVERGLEAEQRRPGVEHLGSGALAAAA